MAPRRGAAGWPPHGPGPSVGSCKGRPLLFEGVLDIAMGITPFKWSFLHVRESIVLNGPKQARKSP